ncbi:MAG: UBP-type zinc finger domain-containing protein [Acidimicrobiia bacterium]|nr:UBP-type zinc finger domain-containing protein [Acidimicrobiia bacterium]
MSSRTCAHFDALDQVAPPTAAGVCPACVEVGDRWVHLRACLVCGQVGCCDQSKNRHARKHWEDSGHPLIQSLEPGESWRFCFIDEAVF